MIETRHINYPTLWKPISIKGVPRDYLIFLALFSGIFNIFGRMLPGFIVFGLGWVFGFIRAKTDPEFFTIYLVKFFRIRKTKGQYRGNRYFA